MSSAAYPGFDARPREGHLRVVTAVDAQVRPGEYVSKNLYFYNPDSGVLSTVDSVQEALKVRIAPTRNPGVIEVLNSPDPAYQFLGVALKRSPTTFGPEDWGAVTLVSNPNDAKLTSVFKTDRTIRGDGWYIGSGGEIVFLWGHTDGFVYSLSHSVESPTRCLFDVPNVPAYANHYFRDRPEKHVDVKIVFEPLDQAGL